MKYKIAIICVFLGKLPNYYQLWLNSCAYNDKFDWFIFTNDKNHYVYPPNVYRYFFTMERLNDRIKEKIGEYCVNKPRKICDYKPLYGNLFEDYLLGYDFWGHCDLDVIWGKLEHFITDDLLASYDRLFRWGHFVLYRNTVKLKEYFSNELICPIDCILKNQEYIGLDESSLYGINALYKKNNWAFYDKDLSLDIEVYKERMLNRRIRNEKGKKIPFIVRWGDSGLNACWYTDNDEYREKEFLYVHLQKRLMNIEICDLSKVSEGLILPHAFVENRIIDKEFYKIHIPYGINGGISGCLRRKRNNFIHRRDIYLCIKQARKNVDARDNSKGNN